MRSTLIPSVVILAVVFAGCSALPGAPIEPTDEPDEPPTETNGDLGSLAVHFVDVGQADAALLVAPSGETILIDSGDWRDDGETVLEYLEHRGVDRIDHLVTTHGHADHIGGHEAVIDRYERAGGGIGAIYDPGVPATTATYERYLDAVERHDVPLFRVGDGDSFDLGDAVSVEFHHPAAERESDDLDDNSLALTITHGENTFLFTGDADESVERQLVSTHGDELAADVYQAGHHGSSTSSSAALLDAVDPAVAVVSSDYESRYDHPDEAVLSRLAVRGVPTYWTGPHGTVAIESDGRTLSVATQTPATADAGNLRSDPESTATVTDPVTERTTIRPRYPDPHLFGVATRGGA